MWNVGRFGYYFDFLLVPILMLGVLIEYVLHDDLLDPKFAFGIAFGFLLWTFLEYWIHRIIFHKFMRRQHWLHHKDPGGYVAAPIWLTGILHFSTAVIALASLGSAAGAGLFCGLEVGYLAYINVHDRIHHGNHRRCGWLRRRWEHHVLHHQGVEVNFGVVFAGWDRVFGTYRDPRKGT